MKYYKHYYESPRKDPVEVSCEEALRTVLGVYRDCDMSRDMLTVTNRIRTKFCDVLVEDETKAVNGKCLVLMAGYYNALPMQYRYDEDGNRRGEVMA